MKKVLIIANLFHASPRIPGLAKFLPEFGWAPVILTTHLGDNPTSSFGPSDDFKNKFEVLEVDSPPSLHFIRHALGFNQDLNVGVQIKDKFNIKPNRPLAYSPLSRLYRMGEAIANYPDAEKGWKPFAIEAGERLLKNGDIEAMISSSSPVTSHIIAKELKLKYGIPWIADLRDLWSQNHNYHYGPIRSLFDRRLELKTLRIADALVTVSPICANELGTLHKRDAYTITNGFDPDKMKTDDIKLTSKLTITYTGQIYTGRQDPSKLCSALNDLIKEELANPEDIEVRFYGPYNELLAKYIRDYGLQDVVGQYGMVPRESSFERQMESQLLLLLNWDGEIGKESDRGVYPLKIFEYLAAQRPIIATGGPGHDVVEALLDETGAGTYAMSVEEIKSTFIELYSEYKKRGEISYNGDPEQVIKYSYRMMARKFAEILDSM